MKKKDFILIISVIIYSWFFYDQKMGINVFLFNLLAVGSLLIQNKKCIGKLSWKIAAASALFSAFFGYYFGNNLCFIANIISLSILSSISLNSNNSVITAVIFSAFTTISAFVYILMEAVKRRSEMLKSDSYITIQKVISIVAPVLIFLLFFFIYRRSNVLFYELTEKINLDFISFSWVLFTFGGFYLLYSFYNPKYINFLVNWESNMVFNISPGISIQNEKLNEIIPIKNELLSGIILLTLLNLLLLVVNFLDLNYLFINSTLPAGISYSDYVHQGVGMLIVSIIIAISIILFYFRGELNFRKESRWLKQLAFLWIFQNSILLLTSAMKNGMYIYEFSLTYKRIGVYIYLILALIGLITTLYKIIQIRSNYFLFYFNSWIFFFVMIMSCSVNWDNIITKYNLNNSKEIDLRYLLDLSYTNIPLLMDACSNTGIAQTKLKVYDPKSKYFETKTFKELSTIKAIRFLKENKNLSWQSNCIEKNNALNKIINKTKKINK